nr:MAG TPA: hypothetical protein [Caudoviricetes sp.]
MINTKFLGYFCSSFLFFYYFTFQAINIYRQNSFSFLAVPRFYIYIILAYPVNVNIFFALMRYFLFLVLHFCYDYDLIQMMRGD